MKKTNKFEHSVTILIIITLIAKLFGALRDLTLGYCFGSTEISDAYLMSTSLPITIFAAINNGIGTCFIPAYLSVKNNEKARKFMNNAITVYSTFSAIIAIVIVLYPDIVINIFAPGFNEITKVYLRSFIRWSICGYIFTMITNFIVFFLTINERTIVQTLKAIPFNLIVIISIIMSYKTGNLLFMKAGIPCSIISELIFVYPELKKCNFKYKFIFDLKDDNLRKMFIWSIPSIISSAIGEINSIVGNRFVSSSNSGSISALTYSSRTIGIVTTGLFAPFVTYLLPELTHDLNNNEINSARERITDSLKKLLSFSIPIMFGTFFCSKEIIAVVFLRGAFTLDNLEITSICFRIHSLSLLFNSITMVIGKVFYAEKDMNTPLIISICSILINYIFTRLLFNNFGIYGSLIASFISTIFVTTVELIIIKHRINLEIKPVLQTISKALIASIAMSIVLSLTNYFMSLLFNSYLITLITSVILGASTYYGLMFLLKADEAFELFKFFTLFKKE